VCFNFLRYFKTFFKERRTDCLRSRNDSSWTKEFAIYTCSVVVLIGGKQSQRDRFKKRAMAPKVGDGNGIKEERYSTNQFYAVPPVAVLVPLSVSFPWQQERQVAVVM
jgi:hypothetical protein